MNNQNGYTLIEKIVGVAVVAGMTAVAIPSYQYYVAKSQAVEADRMINAERLSLITNMKNGRCLPVDGVDTQQGRFGTLKISGTFAAKAGGSCDSGCDLTYTLNSDVQKQIAGKKVVVDARMNGEISKNASTTLAEKFLTDALSQTGAIKAGDNCTVLSKTDPTLTTGLSLGGVDVGEVAPVSPSLPVTPPSGGEAAGGAVGGSEESSGAVGKDEGVRPNGVLCPGTYAVENGEVVIPITSAGSYTSESNYYVKNSINLYDAFVQYKQRVPNSGEKIKFVTPCSVAIVGNSTAQPAITVGNFDSSVQLSLINFGAVLGHGGRGADAGGIKGIRGSRPPENGGVGIYSNTVNLKVSNFGIIAGGGGGAADTLEAVGGGGGAPYGGGGNRLLALGAAFVGSPASLLIGGASGSYLIEGRPHGPGGDIGQDGSIGHLSGANWKNNTRPGGRAGLVTLGNVTITNVGGRTLGN